MDPTSFHLIIEPLDLGAGVRGISLDLKGQGAESPLVGAIASAIWAATIPALAGDALWEIDFTGHLDRVRDFCKAHGMEWRDASRRCVVVPAQPAEKLLELVTRFEAERIGVRAASNSSGLNDGALENELSRIGLDAYQGAFKRYLFCGICDFENGSLTLVTEKLSSSEALRRLRPALTPLGVQVERPE